MQGVLYWDALLFQYSGFSGKQTTDRTPADRIRIDRMKKLNVLVLLMVLSLAGCGDGRPAVVPISGTVTLNGDPVEGVTVMFVVEEVADGYARPSAGKTDAQGKFTISTYGNEDGMPVGKYKVGFIKKELLSKAPENEYSENPEASLKSIKYKWHTPRNVADPNESGITAEVTKNGLEPATFALEGGGDIETDGVMANEP